MTERIQKLLATAGVASRRAIEEWITEGRITVNGRPAEIGQKVGHDDHVRVDGRLVALARKPAETRVLLFRKKTGELVTRDDPEGRRTVFRKLPELEIGRWIAVGRLDINTSGLLLMTNDGELARRLTHPSFGMRRVYAVRVLGELSPQVRQRLLKGVQLDDGPARCDKLVAVEAPEAEESGGSGANRWYEVTMSEGRNRIVRRLFEAEGLQVSRLIRIAYGPVALGRGIKAGSCREATPQELQALMQAVGMSAPDAKAKGMTSRVGGDRRGSDGRPGRNAGTTSRRSSAAAAVGKRPQAARSAERNSEVRVSKTELRTAERAKPSSTKGTARPAATGQSASYRSRSGDAVPASSGVRSTTGGGQRAGSGGRSSAWHGSAPASSPAPSASVRDGHAQKGRDSARSPAPSGPRSARSGNGARSTARPPQGSKPFKPSKPRPGKR